MDRENLSGRNLLQTLVWAGVVLFGLFLLWRFLAGVAAVVLLLLPGVLLAVALSVPVEAIHRLRVPRVVASPVVVVVVLGLLLLIGYVAFPELQRQSFQLSSSIPEAVNDLIGQLRSVAERFGINLGGGGGFSLSSLAGGLIGGVLGIFTSLASIIVGVVAITFLAIYLAANPAPVVGWIVRLFPTDRRDRAREVLAKSRDSLLSWLAGRLISMAIIGVLSTVALYIIGIPAALLLGIFAGLVAFVPYIGPIISVIPPALLALATNPIDALWVVIAYIVIQQIESNLLTPLVMDKVASLHPAAVIGAVTLLGTVFGVLGALLALPIAVVADVLVRELWFRPLEEGPTGAGSEAKERAS